MSELEQLGIQYHRPHPALRPWVSHYFELSGRFDPAEPSSIQTLFPGINCAMIFQLADPVDVLSGVQRWTPRPAAFAEGHFHAPFKLRFCGHFRLAGIEFRAGQAYHFLKGSQALINNEFIDLADVFGNRDSSLSARINPDQTFGQIVSIFDETLISLKPAASDTSLQLSRAINASLQAAGRVTVADMAYAACLSPRQLERRFKDAIGLSPKYLNCVVRFNAFVRICQAKPAIKLTELALECGYFDQAHLIHEFKRFTGETPSKYLESGHEIEAAMTYLQREAEL